MSLDKCVDSLRDWARGDLALEAAVELLIWFHGGRLLSGNWIRRDEHKGDRWYFHVKHAVAEGGHLSGGEQRVLAISASLAVSNRPVDLSDAIAGLDPDTLQLVLDALAHAGGGSSPATLDRPTMSPFEDRPETRVRPDVAESLEGRRPDSEAPPRRLAEDHAETSISPSGDGFGASPAPDLDAPCKCPDRAPLETSKGPLLTGTTGSPCGDRGETIASSTRTVVRPPAAHALLFERTSYGFDDRRGEGFTVTAAFRSRAGCPAQRPPEGPGHSGAKRVNVIRGYDISCLGVPEAPTTGCRGPVVGGYPRHGMSRSIGDRGRGAVGVPATDGALPNGPVRDRSASEVVTFNESEESS